MKILCVRGQMLVEGCSRGVCSNFITLCCLIVDCRTKMRKALDNHGCTDFRFRIAFATPILLGHWLAVDGTLNLKLFKTGKAITNLGMEA